MSATATRRSTRRTAAAAASAESAHSASEHSQQETPPPEVPKKKARKAKAVTTKADPPTATEPQQTVTKTRATSRANAASTTATATTTTTTLAKTAATTTTTPAPPVARKLTRASRAAVVEAGGQASPQRSLDEVRPAKRPRNSTQPKGTSEKRRASTAKLASKNVTNEDENGDGEGLFFTTKFDSELLSTTEPPPAQPVFVNGSESALALLNKIEKSAKEISRVEPAIKDSETHSDNEANMEPTPSQSAKRTFTQVSATPDRAVEKASNIFSRSFSALKSRFFSSPKLPPTSEVTSPTPTKPLPPKDTLTETLSLPPTPVGERVKTPNKRRAPTNTMMKVLLKGVDQEDKRKAEDWARQVIPELRNDLAFREKRRRLETPVLCKDLNFFPSAKPWETGFGDPLGDLDDDDVVPAWAVYLDMKAEEEEHAAKRHKKTRKSIAGDEEVPTIDEQFAASTGARMSPKLYNSHGHSASLYDIRPRRSIDPSPMFSNLFSHSEGGNIFSELQGQETAAKIRENDRETLKSATKETVHTQTQKSVGTSFSVPDDSDEEDATTETETPDAEATPIWTQPPPPAPVPAHAPLPGGSAAEPPLSPPSQQPVDEIERQRQRLMKHTPAKPSRLREATYPSPSVFSDAGNESILAATPVQVPASAASMFADMPTAETIELDDECQAAFNDLINSDEYKQIAAKAWPAATVTYDSDEEELSPASA
ncbi:hypothetical protein ACJQWK_09068 [Exserohilum turcicum]|uniref:Uncharacterized protein n=1 Tax=Exserohilum turcicum (strain 28A) TaxID=671987 RepID=R0K4G6_EXST2|nr:uncharacterized protein SETTUDRAFT_168766 [Exserohilum turcica Et28A]EOA87973.1 hypothetical protein SETTUDRAFT_168766 [Exserohilum turcica Et28A]